MQECATIVTSMSEHILNEFGAGHVYMKDHESTPWPDVCPPLRRSVTLWFFLGPQILHLWKTTSVFLVGPGLMLYPNWLDIGTLLSLLNVSYRTRLKLLHMILGAWILESATLRNQHVPLQFYCQLWLLNIPEIHKSLFQLVAGPILKKTCMKNNVYIYNYTYNIKNIWDDLTWHWGVNHWDWKLIKMVPSLFDPQKWWFKHVEWYMFHGGGV